MRFLHLSLTRRALVHGDVATDGPVHQLSVEVIFGILVFAEVVRIVEVAKIGGLVKIVGMWVLGVLLDWLIHPLDIPPCPFDDLARTCPEFHHSPIDMNDVTNSSKFVLAMVIRDPYSVANLNWVLSVVSDVLSELVVVGASSSFVFFNLLENRSFTIVGALDAALIFLSCFIAFNA